MAVKLKESDWEVLFPAEDFKIGETTLELIPLSLAGLATITRRLTQMVDKVVALELSLDSLTSEAGKIVQLVALILGDAPEILAEMSGVDLDDIKRLPLDVAVSLFSACLDVNLRSQESLLKNFKGLGGKVAKFMGGNQTVQ